MPKVGEDLPKEQRLAGHKRLTPQQQQFLDMYLHKDMTQTEAARQAGYKNPTVQAVRLLRNPVVAERLQEMRLETQARFGVTIDKSIRDLKKIRDQAWEMGKFSDALRAEELRLKAAGLLINKQHVVKEEITANTKQDIANKLADFKRLAESRMVNVTPDVGIIEHDPQDIAEDSG
jgi:phage terminase small subunit|tara:strand:+ start:3419 stop:3946 length:528 start_codon:yes stop_codon:yes gene_type:complete